MLRPRSPFLSVGALLLASTPLVHAQATGVMTQLEQDTARALNLEHVDVVDLELQGAPGHTLNTLVRIDGVVRELVLEPHSNRSENFQVLADKGNGELVEVTPEIVRTYRGVVADLPGATVAAGWLEDGLYAQVQMPDNTRRTIEPVGFEIEGATAASHAVYSDEDMGPSENFCGVDESYRLELPEQDQAQAPGTPTIAFGSTLLVAEIACDTDFEYFQDFGSIAATQARIETVVNGFNVQYERDVAITHEISTIIVRTTPADPYFGNDAGNVLGQFQSEWLSNQGSVQRDIAHLFVGRTLVGGAVGVAFLGTICSTFLGYGLVQSDCCGGFASVTDISAHELGHNWNAGHCACFTPGPGPDFTMNAFLTGANQFSPTATIGTITAFANTRPCLDIDFGAPPPVVNNVIPSTLGVVSPTFPNVVQVEGTGFESITGVLINGQPATVFPPQFQVISDVLLNLMFDSPLDLGTQSIVLQQGSDTTAFEIPVDFNTEPVIDLIRSESFQFTTLPLEIFMGGSPGDIHFLLFSTSPNPTSIPGLFDLDIGDNLASLFLLGSFPIDPATGFAELNASLSGVAPGTELFFQSVTLEASMPTGPLVPSNVEFGTVLF